MIRIVSTLTASIILAGCATGSKLPWTAENIEIVSKKCGVSGIDVNSRGLGISGLSQLGKEPPDAWKIRCLKHRIRVPTDFIFLYT